MVNTVRLWSSCSRAPVIQLEALTRDEHGIPDVHQTGWTCREHVCWLAANLRQREQGCEIRQAAVSGGIDASRCGTVRHIETRV